MKDYYKILEVSKGATKEEIQKSYRNLARKYHPDVNGGDPKYNQIFADISEAYEILKDDDKRNNYNKTLDGETKKEDRVKHSQDGKSKNATKQTEKPFDFSSANSSFEKFFGFNANTGEVTNEAKLKNKNPLDTSDIFKKFMGF